VALCALVFVAALGMPARAPAQQQKSEEVRARELFVFGRYAEALAIYGKLYAETAHPTYLRNVGRCYQNLGEADKAIASFREYLRQVKGISDNDREVVKQYIREMEALKEKQEKRRPPGASPPRAAPEKETATASPPPARDPGTARAGKTREPPLVVRDGGKPPPGPETGTRRVAAYVVGGVALAALGVGGFFGARAWSQQSDSDKLCPMNRCGGNGVALSQDAKSNARIADIAAGAGLLGAGAAVYLFLSSSAAASPETGSSTRASSVSRLRLSPDIGPDRIGLSAGARW